MSDWRYSKKMRPKLTAPRKKLRHNLKNLQSKNSKTLEDNDIQVGIYELFCLYKLPDLQMNSIIFI
jgi:hypothetical protein